MATWIFQGNPKVFPIDEYIMENKKVTWSLKIKKYQEEIALKDKVFIWRTDGSVKNSGGIIALTEVCSKPYYDEKEECISIDLKVISKKITKDKGMLLRTDLKENTKTKYLSIIRSPQGTNFKCTDKEGEYLLTYWNDPSLLEEDKNDNIINQYLEIYSEDVEEHLADNQQIYDNYEFFLEFKKIENLETMEWEDVQKIGEHINGFTTNALARKRALGKPNAPIEKYRKSFMYLIHGKDFIKERINKFLMDDEYKLFGIGDAAVSEIMGNIFPEELCFYNRVDKVVVENILGLSIEYNRKDKFGERFVKFNNLLEEEKFLEKYEDIIGWQTDLPHFLELDQFFYYLIEEFGNFIKVQEEETTEPGGEVQEGESPNVKDEPSIEYVIDEFLNDVFITREQTDDILEALDYKKNIILQGPPGVGKTFMAKRLAYLHNEKKDSDKVEFVQFHQSYSYEDFVRGYKPDDDGKFTLKDGIFYTLCNKAREDKENNYYLIIDEINRGNLSKIFGELMMLIECDKRGTDYEVTLTYHKDDEERFSVPDNLYIIGMMNTADRSLSLVDYALRRRFLFIDVEPAFDTESFNSYLSSKGVSEELILKINDSMNIINEEIENDDIELGKGYKIGHSYFCNIKSNNSEEDLNNWYNRIIKYEIKPLLDEYWFDNKGKVNELIRKIK